MPFDYTIDFNKTNFREHPHLYKVGKGEQGVLLVEPYKSEILPFWRFKTPEIAERSADKIYSLFLNYLDQNDFVGADMARKFLMMGFTRSRRYANHKGGKKYTDSLDPELAKTQLAQKLYPYSSGSPDKHNPVLPQLNDAMTSQKAKSAEIFKRKWYLAKYNELYKKLALEHKEKYGK
jgi:Domain of unknown function (DUF4385)